MKYLFACTALIFASTAYGACPQDATKDMAGITPIQVQAADGTNIVIKPVFKGLSNSTWQAYPADSSCNAAPLPVEIGDNKSVQQTGENAQLSCYKITVEKDTVHCLNTGTQQYSLQYDYRITKDKLALQKEITTVKETGKQTVKEYQRKPNA